MHYFNRKWRKKCTNIWLDFAQNIFFAQTTAPLNERKNEFSKFQPIQSKLSYFRVYFCISISFFLLDANFFFSSFFHMSSLAVVCAKSNWVKNVLFRILFMPSKLVHANKKKMFFFCFVWIIIIYRQNNVLRSNFD